MTVAATARSPWMPRPFSAQRAEPLIYSLDRERAQLRLIGLYLDLAVPGEIA